MDLLWSSRKTYGPSPNPDLWTYFNLEEISLSTNSVQSSFFVYYMLLYVVIYLIYISSLIWLKKEGIMYITQDKIIIIR